VFTARTEPDKKSSKRQRGPDTSSSGPTKHARVNDDKSCTNPNCARKGHLITECITIGGGNQGNYPHWWKGPWNLHLSPEQRTRANNVPPASHSAYAKLSAAAHATTAPPNPSATISTPEDDDIHIHAALRQESPSIVWESHLNDDALVATLPVLQNTLPADSCYYDCGANRHVFNDRTAFETYEQTQPVSVKGFGHDLSAVAVGRGSVRLQSRCRNQTSSIILSHVLHIPAARTNLISGAQLDKVGVIASIAGGCVTLTFGGSVIVDGSINNGMYGLNVSIMRPLPPPPLLSRIKPFVALAESAPRDFYTALWDT
jgi:hypothetical protein